MKKIDEYFLYNMALQRKTPYINQKLKFYNPAWRVVSTLLKYHIFFRRIRPAEIIRSIDSRSTFNQISMKKLKKILAEYRIDVIRPMNLLEFYTDNSAFDGLIRFTNVNTHKKEYVYFQKHHGAKKCTFRFATWEFEDCECLPDFISQYCYKPDIEVLKVIKRAGE